MTTSEQKLLAEINADISPDVDWKQGAVDYLRELVGQKGDAGHWYHFVKPFVGGPDFTPFWVDVFYFLDMIKELDLPHRARIIDVGCGPGWTTQWLCKLGHQVIGLDISPELLAIAKERLETEPYAPFHGEPLAFELREHDIEAAPVGLDTPYEFALFESTLHHFYDPVSALRNVAADLSEHGVIAIIEASAPARGTVWYENNLDLMRTYRTIERPYTRAQMLDLLALTGFEYCEFYSPINGLFTRTADEIEQVSLELTVATNHQLLIASRTREGIARIVGDERVRTLRAFTEGWQFASGFYGEEIDSTGRRFRWCRPEGYVHFDSPGQHVLTVGTHGLEPSQQQRVYARRDGEIVASVTLTSAVTRASTTFDVEAGTTLVFQSDRAFSPSWHAADDARLLSFYIDCR
jgi:SAM-dependent methyltransferase